MITTHVLDTSVGKPAAGIPIRLDYLDPSGAWTPLANGSTDSDGRASNLLAAGYALQNGRYRLNFGLDAYFRAQGKDAFFPEASLIFSVADAKNHYHVRFSLAGLGFRATEGVKMNTDSILRDLTPANREYLAAYPGENPGRQPVHTVYGGAQIFVAETAHKMRDVALRSLREYVGDPETLREIFGLDSSELAKKVYLRVQEKLSREAVEDFRIDFEDGFGVRPEAEEDAEAVRAAKEVARGAKSGVLPPFIGIRIKSLSEELKARALRTLDLFITTLAEEMDRKKSLPSHFVVTIPKITHIQQIKAVVAALELLEAKTGLPAGSILVELMVETPQTIFGRQGEVTLPAFVAACKGRCRGAHFGTYDYTASMSVTADHQRMDHPACDFARNVMKVALAGTGVWLSDGATNIMPVPTHRAPANDAERAENRKAVHDAWRINYAHIQHSLVNAYYQGWDLHPAQLPVRYAALYAFFLSGFEATARRLRLFVEQAAKATLLGNVFDDAATGQGLLNYFLRGLSCGAISESEIGVTGLTLDEIRTRSFKKILDSRTQNP